MKGIIAKTLTAVCLAGGGLATAGCWEYRDLVDPCYPERYNFAARQEVKEAFGAESQNGHILDQTIWNYDFEPGTANLTAGGEEHLAYLARRRPSPDPTVYLQVAQDVGYDPARPAQFIEARNALDSKRVESIQNFLNAQTAGRGMAFNVVRHDPAEVGLSAIESGTSVRIMQSAAQGTLIKAAIGAGGAAR